MTNKEFGKEIEKRTKNLAVQVIRLSSTLPNSQEGRVIRNQLSKSGSSIGANYFEANRSRSKRDFANKLKICESEANETVFWLEVIKDLNWVDDKANLAKIEKEVKELLALFTSISKKMKE